MSAVVSCTGGCGTQARGPIEQLELLGPDWRCDGCREKERVLAMIPKPIAPTREVDGDGRVRQPPGKSERCHATCEDRRCSEWSVFHGGPHHDGALSWDGTHFWWRNAPDEKVARRCRQCAEPLAEDVNLGCTVGYCSRKPTAAPILPPWSQYDGKHLPRRITPAGEVPEICQRGHLSHGSVLDGMQVCGEPCTAPGCEGSCLALGYPPGSPVSTHLHRCDERPFHEWPLTSSAPSAGRVSEQARADRNAARERAREEGLVLKLEKNATYGKPAADYGKTCNARFWPEPHERVCALPPGHEGGHDDDPRRQCGREAPTGFGCVLLRGHDGPHLDDIPEVDREVAAADMSERFHLLQWAGSHPGMLSLLRALQAANYDETGTEYLRRIVSRAPAEKRTFCRACGGIDHHLPTCSEWCPPHGTVGVRADGSRIAEIDARSAYPLDEEKMSCQRGCGATVARADIPANYSSWQCRACTEKDHPWTVEVRNDSSFQSKLFVDGPDGPQELLPPRPDADLERYEDIRVRKYPPSPLPLVPVKVERSEVDYSQEVHLCGEAFDPEADAPRTCNRARGHEGRHEAPGVLWWGFRELHDRSSYEEDDEEDEGLGASIAHALAHPSVPTEPAPSTRLDLQGTVFDGDDSAPLSICSCAFLALPQTPHDSGNLYERRTDAECEVHGGEHARNRARA